MDGVRLDKWLWAARFFKTRALAVEAIAKGRVQCQGAVAKAGRDVHVGALLRIEQPGGLSRDVVVQALSSVRGPATAAALLYTETPQSQAARAAALEARRLAPEPADSLRHGRPTKQDRRQLAQWQRWSVQDEG